MNEHFNGYQHAYNGGDKKEQQYLDAQRDAEELYKATHERVEQFDEKGNSLGFEWQLIPEKLNKSKEEQPNTNDVNKVVITLEITTLKHEPSVELPKLETNPLTEKKFVQQQENEKKKEKKKCCNII